MKRGKRVLGFTAMFILAIGLFSAAVMLLWNSVIPSVFGWNEITYLQAMGLLLLTRIMFGNFGTHRRWNGNRSAIREKWLKMSPEEREEFANRHHHHGRSCHTHE